MRLRAATSFSAMAAIVALALALSGCGQGAQAGPAAGTTDSAGGIAVVASTNVYGSIAAQIGGDKVHVTSLIGNAAQDPHSYEATPQDKLAVSKAQLAIENGGGYDDFFDKLADGTLDPGKLVNVVDLSGLRTAQDASFNEHVWYDLPVMEALADTLAARLGKLDPGSAAAFTANAAAFKTSLQATEGKVAALRSAHAGEPVAITEAVPLYLLKAAGLVNKTPEEYSHAIEDGTDVPAGVLKDTTGIISAGQVKLLAYNSQTEGPKTEVLKKAAQQAGVPVVEFTETLPAGASYSDWMAGNVSAIANALDRR